MVDGCHEDSPVAAYETYETGVSPESNTAAAGGDDDFTSGSGGRSPKRSRRSVQKRVVSVPIGDGDGSRSKSGGGGGGEGAPPPADSWAWRKYGQKPIKGSPYPRGYYRCSSSKGCPARKQVERNRVDPTMLVITYSFEHNHPWPLPKNSHSHHHRDSAASVAAPAAADSKPADPVTEHSVPPLLRSSSVASADTDHKFADLICEDLIPGSQFPWFSGVGSPSSSTSQHAAAEDPLLYGPIYGGAAILYQDECDKLGDGDKEEEDSLFAGLGELPECAMVFRRGFLERQMRGEAQGDSGVSAAAL